MFDRDEIAQLCGRAEFGRKTKAEGREGIAVSSHPIVSRVATNVLRDGGNAVDAILAASLAQTVVEPHMTTAFGVLSMMHFEPRPKKRISARRRIPPNLKGVTFRGGSF